MKVELLHIADCPNWEVAAARLRQALGAEGLDPDAFAVRCLSEPAPGFHGSPTILVDGRDPFPSPPEPVGLACRRYGVEGAPSVEELTTVLRSTP